MYPNTALSAGQMVLVAVVALGTLAIWLTAVFVAARPPRRRDASSSTTSLPQHHLPVKEEPGTKAA